MRTLKLTLILWGACVVAGLVWVLASAEQPQDYVVAVVVVAVCAGVFWIFLRPLLRAQSLLEHGLPAEAAVLKVWDTGTTINDDPQLGLLLDVRPSGEPPFQAESKSVISRLLVAEVRPGAVVQVRYDPRTHNVAVAPAADVQPGEGAAAARLRELDAWLGIDIVGAGADTVQFLLRRAPKGKEAAALGKWLLAFCPDLRQAPRNLGRAPVVLWWD